MLRHRQENVDDSNEIYRDILKSSLVQLTHKPPYKPKKVNSKQDKYPSLITFACK